MHGAEELAELRARAYGRDADIFDDPAALHRLRELEEQAPHGTGTVLNSNTLTGAAQGRGADAVTGTGDRAEASSPVASGTPVDFAAVTAEPAVSAHIGHDRAPDEAENGHRGGSLGEASGTPPRLAPESPDAADARPERAADIADLPVAAAAECTPAEPRPFTRRLAAIWAASVVAASVITGFVVATVVDYDPTVVATLHEAPEFGAPDWLDNLPISEGSEPPVQFEDYFGLTVLTFTWDDGLSADSTNQTGSAPERRCIALAAGPDENSSAASAGGCSEGGLEAIAEFIVSPGSPEELQSVHEIGTAIRFVQDGNRIVVHAGGPSTATG